MVIITIALNFSVWQEEGFLLTSGMASGGLSANVCDPASQTILFPTHFLILQEGNKKLSAYHLLPGNANHPPTPLPQVRVLLQVPLTVLNAFDQILEVETGLVFRERFESWHFHHRPERWTHA